MIYVTMTDKFLSGWGMAEGKKNKLIFECEDYEDAQTVATNARNRSDQKYINICEKKPYYNSRTFFVQLKTKKDYGNWYIPDFFKK